MDWTFLKTLKFEELNLDKEDQDILHSLAERLQDNYPYHAQHYAGQMIKPPHPLAQAAQWMASFVNPNNHALDGGRATSALELEVISQLGQMMGFTTVLGHLTAGGTMANLEALWISRKIDANTTVLANELAHYTHSRMTEVLGIPFKAMPADAEGRMCLSDLKLVLTALKSKGQRATIVATLGTTGTGSIDPLEDIIDLAKQFDARIHVDAAYGGYFKLADVQHGSKRHFEAVQYADSIVIDPHKHGLQPYGCGAVLFKDPTVGRFYKHDSPYTYFTSTDLHLGEITLECSRSGAAAAGVWATLKKFPLVPRGVFAKRLNHSLQAANGLHRQALDFGYHSLPPALDICVFSTPGKKASLLSAQNRDFFERKAAEGIHLALLKLKPSQCPWAIEWDIEELVVIRSVLMKPEHNDPHFWKAILG